MVFDNPAPLITKLAFSSVHCTHVLPLDFSDSEENQ